MEIKEGEYYRIRDGNLVYIEQVNRSIKDGFPVSIKAKMVGLDGSLSDNVLVYNWGGYRSKRYPTNQDLVEWVDMAKSNSLKGENNMLDFNRPLQTKSGNDVIIYAVEEDDRSGVPVKGVIKHGKKWGVAEWDVNGVHCPSLDESVRMTDFDLVYKKQTKRFWVFLMKDYHGEISSYYLNEDFTTPPKPSDLYGNVLAEKLVEITEGEFDV